MAAKRLPNLPFLPNVPPSVTPAYAHQLNLAINSLYRTIAASVDAMVVTATNSTQFPAAQGFRRLGFDGSNLYIDWNTTSWTPIAGGGAGPWATGVMTTTAGGSSSGTTFNQAFSKLAFYAGSNILLSAATAASAVSLTINGASGSGTFTVETLTGTCNSSNLIFTCANTPLYVVMLTVNEAVMLPGTHYSRVGTTITFAAGQAPDPGDIVSLRYYY